MAVLRNKMALPAVLAKCIFSKPMLSIRCYMDEKTTPMLSCNQTLTIVPGPSPQDVQNSRIIYKFQREIKEFSGWPDSSSFSLKVQQ